MALRHSDGYALSIEAKISLAQLPRKKRDMDLHELQEKEMKPLIKYNRTNIRVSLKRCQ